MAKEEDEMGDKEEEGQEVNDEERREEDVVA